MEGGGSATKTPKSPCMWVAGDGEQEGMVMRKTCTLSPQGSGNKRACLRSLPSAWHLKVPSLSDTFLVALPFFFFFRKKKNSLKQFIVCIREKQGK